MLYKKIRKLAKDNPTILIIHLNLLKKEVLFLNVKEIKEKNFYMIKINLKK